MRRTMLVLLAASCIGDAHAAEGEFRCKGSPEVIAPCYSVHGRLSAYNGTPGLRIWPVGTHRLLGVFPDEEPLALPSNIRNAVGFGKDIYGDFLVCPFAKQEPGHMQFVCLQAASNVHVQTHP